MHEGCSRGFAPTQAYLWPFEPTTVRDSAYKFERRNVVLRNRAQGSLRALHRNGDDGLNMKRFNADLWELRASRFDVQPLRLRALVSPRQGPLGHLRLEGLERTGADGGEQVGGPWRMSQRLLEMTEIEQRAVRVQ